MANNTFIDNAKVMSKGQITFQKILEIFRGFFRRQGDIRCRERKCQNNQFCNICNGEIAKADGGRGHEAGLNSEESVIDLVREVRADGEE